MNNIKFKIESFKPAFQEEAGEKGVNIIVSSPELEPRDVSIVYRDDEDLIMILEISLSALMNDFLKGYEYERR